MALSITEKAEKYEKIVEKKKVEKAEMHHLAMRGIEGASAATSSVALGAINAWKPELADIAYGLVQPNVIAAGLGAGLFFAAGPKNDAVREIGFGVALSGIVPLCHQGGAKLYSMLTAA